MFRSVGGVFKKTVAFLGWGRGRVGGVLSWEWLPPVKTRIRGPVFGGRDSSVSFPLLVLERVWLVGFWGGFFVGGDWLKFG